MLVAIFVAVTPAAAQKRIALTFDDVPRGRGAFLTPDQRTVKLIAGLKRAGVAQAAFFVNPANLETGDGQGAARTASSLMSPRAMSSPTIAGATRTSPS